MQIDRTYSLQDIADKLNRPRTTLNNWYQSFKSYFPVVGSGRTKRFKEESIDIFRLIMELKDRNEPQEVIEQYLNSSVSEVTIYDDEAEPAIKSMIKGYESILEEVQNQRDFMKQLYEDSQASNRQLAAALEKNSNLIQSISHSLMDNSGKQEQQLTQIKEALEADNKEQTKREQQTLDKLSALLDKSGTEPEGLTEIKKMIEDDRKRIAERDKETMEKMNQIIENRKENEPKPWYKKLFNAD